MRPWADVNVTHPPVITTAPTPTHPSGSGVRAHLRGARSSCEPIPRRPSSRSAFRRKAHPRMSPQLQLPCCTTTPARTRPSSAFTTPTGPADATDPASVGRSALERRARLTGRLAKLAATGHLAPLARQISTLGGCAHPIRLTGQRTRIDTVTGQVLDGPGRPARRADGRRQQRVHQRAAGR